MDLVEIGWCAVDLVGMAQGKDNRRSLVNEAMNLLAS
jgi:hypothetical protein